LVFIFFHGLQEHLSVLVNRYLLVDEELVAGLVAWLNDRLLSNVGYMESISTFSVGSSLQLPGVLNQLASDSLLLERRVYLTQPRAGYTL
jgi:hypothetical protein